MNDKIETNPKLTPSEFAWIMGFNGAASSGHNNPHTIARDALIEFRKQFKEHK